MSYNKQELQRGMTRNNQVHDEAHTRKNERVVVMRPRMQKPMERRTYCVYNQTRECFLSLGVTPADTVLARLKGLIGKLDENYKVIHVIEHFPRFRIAPIRIKAASVLELPTHTIYSSQTQVGDQLIICGVEEIESRFNKGQIAKIESQAR